LSATSRRKPEIAQRKGLVADIELQTDWRRTDLRTGARVDVWTDGRTEVVLTYSSPLLYFG